MPAVRDATDVRWTVRRVRWPFGTRLWDLPDWDWSFILGEVRRQASSEAESGLVIH